MNSQFFDRLANVSLRLITLGTRFVFIILLAKLVEPAEVGYYGLFAVTVGYAMLFAGMDFYTFVTREILSAPVSTRGGMIRAQAFLTSMIYLALIPLVILLLIELGWPPVMLWWFAPILLLEHFNQEISRLLIAFSEQISASIVLFVRQGSWAIGVVILMLLVPESRRLEVLFPAWAIAGLIAAALGYWKLWSLGLGGWRNPIDWAWVRKGIYVSVGFLTATMALRATQTIDRYWLEALTSVETLAAYVLYFGIAASILTFLDAGVFAFAYPKLIQLHRDKDYRQARTLLRLVLKQTLVVTFAFAVMSWLVLPYLIYWIDNPVYGDAIGIYPWILFATVINAIGLVPHYGLYAKGIDRPIIQSHIAGFLTFVISVWGLSSYMGGLAVPVGLLLSFLVILAWKSIAYVQVTHA